MNKEFLSKILSTTDVMELVLLREQLVLEASRPEMSWDSRMDIYKKVERINERIYQLEG
ncbi:hypothetical protein [Brevibacillus borstelensis]|uniref:hypothetical protein n=1 Tax=Brevibacillus borstelensis TaxID=45462 RepID=UPI00039AB76B|nr:hypothetical protein [Brevibacillus borstelensis]